MISLVPPLRIAALGLAILLLTACATSPTGRNQLIAVSDTEMDRLGASSFERILREQPLARDPRKLATARCIVEALRLGIDGPGRDQPWQVQVFEQADPNAFALPGGKMGIHTGMWTVARNQDELATVLAHEMAHVLARHAAERVSQRMAAGLALSAIAAHGAGQATSEDQRLLLAALGVGATVGVLLPFSRVHETEADVLGQQIMARAGFDPRAAALLWRNMQATERGGRPPAFLSTHPGSATRILELESRALGWMPSFEQARAAGRRPDCR